MRSLLIRHFKNEKESWGCAIQLSGTGHYLSPGGGGGGGGKQGDVSDSPFDGYFTEVIPPNNI